MISASTLTASNTVPRILTQPFKALTARRSLPSRLGIVAMASSAGTKLGKDTPDSTWKEVLSTDEYRILRQKGTEPAGSGLYNKHKVSKLCTSCRKKVSYRCAGCQTPIYTSETKFDSGCGWPAFYAEIPGAIDRHVDNAFGMKRVEITCANCGGHLGHVFENEGFPTPTDQRHCVNSKSIKFEGSK